jgi:hypothetical protein
MNRTIPPPIALDVCVTLTAIILSEDDGGY